MLHLSALQSAEAQSLDLRSIKIDIDNAPPLILKLALVLVGVDRAPENIFDPRHANSEIVRVLGSHEEPVVSQYSVWAISENDELNASHLGIDLRDIEVHPENVRSYTYRLFGSEANYSHKRHEIILQGSRDESEEARSGLAKGLRDAYYDGLDQIVLNWFPSESSPEVHSLLSDHIIRQAEKSTAYSRLATEFYGGVTDPVVRRRMEAAAVGTSLFREFRRMAAQAELGQLFEGGISVTNTYNIKNLQSGVTAFGGNASNEGDINQHLTTDQQEKALQILGQVQGEIEKLPSSARVGEAKELIQSAREDPSRSSLSAVVNVLMKLKDGLTGAAQAGEAIAKIGGLISALTGLLT